MFFPRTPQKEDPGPRVWILRYVVARSGGFPVPTGDASRRETQHTHLRLGLD